MSETDKLLERLLAMAARYNATEYMYSSARVRALENKLVGKEQIEQMLGAKSSGDILSRLFEFGFRTERDGVSDRESILLSVLEDAFSEVGEMSPDGELLHFLQYQYDCNNIKAVLKCHSRGIEPDGMMFGFGSVGVGKVKEMVRTKDYSALPQNMAKAAQEAESAFAKTQNPQTVDLYLDRACFADMLEAANETGVDYIVDLVRTKIDFVNILTTLRIIRMNHGAAGVDFLEKSLLCGGFLPQDKFIGAFAAGENALFDSLRYSDYSSLVSLIEHGKKTLTEIERELDDAWLDKVREAKFIPYGAEVLAAYIIAVEYEVRNVRIILAGKDAGLDSDVIRERVRASYV